MAESREKEKEWVSERERGELAFEILRRAVRYDTHLLEQNLTP